MLCFSDTVPRYPDVAARRILVQGRWGLRHVRPVEADLPRERLEGGQRGEHQAEAVAPRIRERAVRARGHEERRVGLLDTDGEHFILPRYRRVEEWPLMRGAPCVQELQDEGKRLFLPVVAGRELSPEAGELVGPIA